MCHQHTVTNLLLLPEFTITGLKASTPSPGTCSLLAGFLVCQAPAAYRHLLVTPVSYIIYYGMHSVHAILASSKNRDLGTRVWVAACVLLGVSPGCIFPTGCPAEEPTRHGCTTWGCAPRCCSQRLFVSRCILSIGRPAKTIHPPCAIGTRYSLFHYGQGYALSSRHFVRLKGFHGTEECA